MSSPEPYLPPPKTYKYVPLVPAVDPEDLKRVWNVKPPWKSDSHEKACSPGADVNAVVRRRHMIDILTTHQLLDPWTRNGQLADALFRLAATFPLHEWQDLPYKIPGDEYYPFDPNAFLTRLVEETGVAHTWEPVTTRVPEGGRGYVTTSASIRGAVPDPEHEASNKTRELLWNLWTRFSGYEQLLARPDADSIRLGSILFADFLIANADLVRQAVDAFRHGPGAGEDLLLELEKRAMRTT